MCLMFALLHHKDSEHTDSILIKRRKNPKRMNMKTTGILLTVFLLSLNSKGSHGRPARLENYNPNKGLQRKITKTAKNQELQFMPPLNQRDTASTHVAFKAILSRDITNPYSGETVIFDQRDLDTTNSYNPNIGVFTAPVNGVYYISLTVSSQSERSDHGVHLDLKKDGASVGQTYLDNNVDWLKRNEVVILHLNAGDHLYVKIDYALHPCTINGGTVNTHFQGFLIFPD